MRSENLVVYYDVCLDEAEGENLASRAAAEVARLEAISAKVVLTR